tara:strand:- start:184 stop:933 length:750 start_codon:yes stop_codon:yes gene_type:complete
MYDLHLLLSTILVYNYDKSIIKNIKIKCNFLKDYSIADIFTLLIDCLKENYISFNGNYSHDFKNPIGFFIYKYDTIKKNGIPLFFKYANDVFIDNDRIISGKVVNEVDKRKIMLQFLKKKEYYKRRYKTDSGFGYIVFNNRKNKYLFKCDLDGKSNANFPDPGPGKIANEEVPGWYFPQIQEKFEKYTILKEYYDKLKESFRNEYILKPIDNSKKDNILLILEMILRVRNIHKNVNSFYYLNQMWLKYL